MPRRTCTPQHMRELRRGKGEIAEKKHNETWKQNNFDETNIAHAVSTSQQSKKEHKEPPATVSNNASRDPRGMGASAPAQGEGSANGTARARITWLRQNAPHEWQSFGKHNVRRRQAEHQETCHMHGNNQNSERSRNEGPTVRWQTALYTSDRNGRCSCKERAETSTKPSRTHLGAAIRLQGSEVAPRWACTRAISREKKKTVGYKRKSRQRCVASLCPPRR